MPYANNHGIRLHYQVEGEGPPLVLQHGFSDSLESWWESQRLLLCGGMGARPHACRHVDRCRHVDSPFHHRAVEQATVPPLLGVCHRDFSIACLICVR